MTHRLQHRNTNNGFIQQEKKNHTEGNSIIVSCNDFAWGFDILLCGDSGLESQTLSCMPLPKIYTKAFLQELLDVHILISMKYLTSIDNLRKQAYNGDYKCPRMKLGDQVYKL